MLSLPGGVTGIGDAWTAPSWRAARPTDETDPWAAPGTPIIPTPVGMMGAGAAGLDASAGPAGVLPAGVGLTGHGGVGVAGLEWLGARAYDPATRGLLSTDPLAPVLGAGWDGNPYAYAGNNPLNTTDPTGLRPLTDDELKAYDQTAGSHWEYVVAGLAVAGAVAVMFVPGLNLIAAGVIAGALASGGLSAFSQKAQKGSVDWWSVLGNAAVGAATGAAGGGGALWAKGLVAAAPARQTAAAFGTAAAVGGGVGSVASAGTYLWKNDWQIRNGWEFAGSVLGGGLAGAVGGLAGPAGGSIAAAAGRSSTGALATTATGAVSALGAGSGAALQDATAGKPVDPANIAASALFGGVTASVPLKQLPVVGQFLGQTGVNTLKQVPYFAPRTLSGAFDLSQTNTVGLWGGAIGGAAVGFGGDMVKELVGW